MKSCPSCRAEMGRHLFEPMMRVGGAAPNKIEVDICWPCHLIWFDGFESTQLSPRAVVEFFKLIHSHQNDGTAMQPVTQKPDCPICGSGLRDTNDLAGRGRFKYWRCPVEHGRLITFVQFLREKNFIRDLSNAEIDTLAATVKQIKCSSCGGPIDLRKDHACGHCGAAISVLDKEAVTKTVGKLLEAHEVRLANGKGAREFSLVNDGNAQAEAILAAARYESDLLKERRRREREGGSLGSGTGSGRWSTGDAVDLARAGDLLADSIGDFFSGFDF